MQVTRYARPRSLAGVAREHGVPALVPANEVGFDGSQRPCRRYRPSPDRVREGATALSYSRRSLFSAPRPHSVADRQTIPRLRQHADRRGIRCSARWPILVSQRRLGGVGIPAWHREPIEQAPVWESIHLASWPANRLARPVWRRLLPEAGARVRRLRPRERLLRRPCGPARWRRPSPCHRSRSRRRCPNAV